MKQLLLILSLVFVFGVNAVANTPDTKSEKQPYLELPKGDELDSFEPFMVDKPHLCQNGDAFIRILELRGEYRAFMGQGQLVKKDGAKIFVWVFTAVNLKTQSFTIFEFHPDYNMACVRAVGKGFEILMNEDDVESTSIHVRNILTL